MQKLILKIQEAKIKTGLSNPELSIKLGHSRKYLTNLVNDGCTTQLQNQLIEELDQVIAGTFKTDEEVIAELTQKLSNAQDLVANKVIENYKLNLDIDRLKNANIELMEESDRYHNANNELNAELNTMRKNAQEADRALEIAKDDLDYIREENDQLREAVSELTNNLKQQNILAWLSVIVIMVLSYFLWSK